MDKEAIRLLLESYRPQDAHDPIFAEALKEVAADPELAAWFESSQRFDGIIAAKLKEVPVPEEVKSHIHLGYQAAATKPPVSRVPGPWIWVGAMAAAGALVLTCWMLFAPATERGDRLALQAIAYSEQMPALQFVCFDADEVSAWINEQPGTQQLGFTMPKLGKAADMRMIGSSIVDWNGQPVVMVCLQNGGKMAMLYILDAKSFGDLPEGATTTVSKADWVVRTTKTGGRVKVLTAKGRPEDLPFEIPL